MLKVKIDDIMHQIELIKIHTKACAFLEIQKAHFGMHIPLYIQIDYDERQEIIKDLAKKVVEKTKDMPSDHIQELAAQIEEKIPEKIIISDSSNVFVNTKIEAGRDVIILNINAP